MLPAQADDNLLQEYFATRSPVEFEIASRLGMPYAPAVCRLTKSAGN
jgi:hypothetical protein